MRRPQPIIVSHLFPEILEHLLALLSGLTAEEWDRATACAGWSVKDVSLHLLAVQIGNLSRRRDQFTPPARNIRDQGDLLVFVNDLNASWVQAAQRLSSRLLCDLLRFTGEQVNEYFASLGPYLLGEPVNWAGPEPAPVWLDLAREYTEFWHHQQHIRDAVGKPGLKEPRYFAPVLDAFVRALPYTYQKIEASSGTLVVLTISGESGGQWFLLREGKSWNLYLEAAQPPNANVIIDQDVAWRLFSKGLDQREVQAQTTIIGDRLLGMGVLDMVSIIA